MKSIYLAVFIELCFIFSAVVSENVELSQAQLGNFTILWNTIDQPYIAIKHNQNPDKIEFQTTKGVPFIGVAYGYQRGSPIVSGNAKLQEWLLPLTSYQNIIRVSLSCFDQSRNISNSCFKLFGDIWGWTLRVSYELEFYIPEDVDHPSLLLHNQLAFRLKLTQTRGRTTAFNRIILNYWCDEQESFHGFGVQYSVWNMNGRRVPILVSEQGIGRGAEWITTCLNLFADRSGGDWSTSYAPKPIYLTNQYRAFILENSEISIFDFRDLHSVRLEVWSSSKVQGRIVVATSSTASSSSFSSSSSSTLLNLISEITKFTGRMSPLPAWTQKGAIIRLQGGTQAIFDRLHYLMADEEDDKDSVPWKIAAVWMQDWVGTRYAFDGNRLLWHWQLDDHRYPGWQDRLVPFLREKGIKLLTYINPFFSDPNDPHYSSNNNHLMRSHHILPDNVTTTTIVTNTSALLTADDQEEGSEGGRRSRRSSNKRNYYQEGMEEGYFVMNPHDDHKKPYLLQSGSITFATIDFTNPFAREWMKQIIKIEMIDKTSVSGAMADFGEYLPMNALLYDRTITGEEYHNLYPQAFAKLLQEVTEEHHATNKQEDEDDGLLFFLRSAWLQSPRYAQAFWLGDQLVSWDKHDGMKSTVLAFLTGGLSGHSLTHSDIGGYMMQDDGPFIYKRSQELLVRWTEYAAFSGALFRTHTGLSAFNVMHAQVYSNEKIRHHFKQFAYLFSALADYRQVLMQEAYALGWPLVRPMAAHFDYGNDDERRLIWSLTEQYMFGADFLIAPVLEPASSSNTAASFYNNNHDHHHWWWHPRSIDSTRPYLRSLAVGDKTTTVVVTVYLPALMPTSSPTGSSCWIHLWSGECIPANARDDASRGQYIYADAPIGAPPIFYRSTSTYGQKLRKTVHAMGMQQPMNFTIPVFL